jgi:pSer/pThr/pTyr-binding forkhead associated (FHA) protein
MALTVVVRSGDVASPTISFDAPRLVIGRGPSSEIRLPDPSISQRHASIQQRGGDYIIIDEGSTNGTFVGPVRLSPHAARVLRSGDLVRVGRIWLELRVEAVPPSPNPQQSTKELALALVAGALSAQGEQAAPRVLVTEGPDIGRELTLQEIGRPYVIGRGKVDLTLEEADASRRHVELERRGDQLLVRDLGSKNGTLLGERRLEANKSVPWPRSARLVIGEDRLVYDDPVGDALAELERAADERLRSDTEVEAPTGLRSQPTSDVGDAARPEPGKASPIAVVPKRSARGRAKRGGWNMTDVLVAALALAVLSLSILGLMWLLRSQ